MWLYVADNFCGHQPSLPSQSIKVSDPVSALVVLLWRNGVNGATPYLPQSRPSLWQTNPVPWYSTSPKTLNATVKSWNILILLEYNLSRETSYLYLDSSSQSRAQQRTAIKIVQESIFAFLQPKVRAAKYLYLRTAGIYLTKSIVKTRTKCLSSTLSTLAAATSVLVSLLVEMAYTGDHGDSASAGSTASEASFPFKISRRRIGGPGME